MLLLIEIFNFVYKPLKINMLLIMFAEGCETFILQRKKGENVLI